MHREKGGPTLGEKIEKKFDTWMPRLIVLAIGALGVESEIIHVLSKKKFEKEEQENIERDIDRAFDTAAKHFRTDMAFVETVHEAKGGRREATLSEEEQESIATELENFSSHDFFVDVARFADLSVLDIARLNIVSHVSVYTPEIGEKIRRRYRLSREEMQHISKIGGGNIADKKLIVINGEEVKMAGATTDVVRHELMHGFWGEEGRWGMESQQNKDPARYAKYNNRISVLYEGTTELLANIIYRQGQFDPYTGYADGGTMTASVVYESLPSQKKKEAWQSYVKQDLGLYQKAYDEEYGPESFNDALFVDELAVQEGEVEKDLEASVRGAYTVLAPLNAFLDNTGNEWGRITKEANIHVSSFHLVPIKGSDFSGVFVLSGKKRGELHIGMIRLQKRDGVQILFLVEAEERDMVGGSDVMGTNVSFYSINLKQHLPEEKKFEEMTLEERGAVVVRALQDPEFKRTLEELRERPQPEAN